MKNQDPFAEYVRPHSTPAPDKRPLNIGTPLIRLDAYEKVTGQTKYAADYYSSNMLWGGVKRAGIPHARLTGVNTDLASRVPGVVRILTSGDISGSNRQGVIKRDQPVLVDDKIRHCGDAVALVLAETKAALKESLDLIDIDIVELPALLNAEEALGEDSPLVHEDNAEGNVLLKGDLKIGKGREAEEESDLILEACFETPRQEHAYLETEAGWACVDSHGKVGIVCSTQTPFRDRMEVAEALGLDPNKIRIIAPYLGGAFGGKDGVTVQSLLALAAMNADRRPVKMWWDREESFLSGTKRHHARMYYRLGAKSDGSLNFLDVRLHLDTGPYDHLGGVVLTLALEHAGGPYRIPNAVIKGWAVYTNNPIGGAFRGFGVPQVTAAMEQMMDMLAHKLDIDPLELRLKNAVKRGDKNCVGKTLVSSTGAVECLETLSRHPLWEEREAWRRSAPSMKYRGVGIAAVMQASGYGPVVPDYANAKVELTETGKIRVYCGVVDMGQGNAGTNLQIAGSILVQDSSNMELVLPDTDLTLPSCSASASRCTYTFGNALIGAAELLKERIVQRAADMLMARPEELALIPGGVRRLTDGRELSLELLSKFLDESERIATYRFRAPVATDQVTADEGLRLHGMPHTLFSYGAHLAFVEIDELTGQLDIKRYLSVSDCGKVINPEAYEQQIHGGIAHGLGLALSEDFEVADGKIMTPDLMTYVIPTASDMPEFDSVPVEIYEPTGPFGLKGVGEIATNGPLPAVANAVADALNVRLFRFPLTPERILQAVKNKSQEK